MNLGSLQIDEAADLLHLSGLLPLLNVGVYVQRGGYVGMPEDDLEGLGIHAGLNGTCGEGVPQGVEREVRNACSFAYSVQLSLD